MKLVDTTVAVDHLRGVPAATDLLARLVSDGETLVASEITRFELLAGVREGELEALEIFFSSLVWVPISEEISRTAGTLARRLRRSHGGIDDADYLIAARHGDGPRSRPAHHERSAFPHDPGAPGAVLNPSSQHVCT